MERHQRRSLRMASVDLEETYVRVPRQELWRYIRKKGIIEDMYEMVMTLVRSSVDMKGRFSKTVGSHWGSPYGSRLFDCTVDVLTDQSSWCMTFGGNIIICSSGEEPGPGGSA
ncbi:uncharacterized protein LOC143039068 [Oratosquilla oratoria]|uniref:uncharacterized protein LOC143039068 n=1 Tax=Oratosquilla oratoria TaxID=337810 RepID=UPI003F76E22A